MGLVSRFEGKAVKKNYRSILAEYEDVYEAEFDDNQMQYIVPICQYRVSFYLFGYDEAIEYYSEELKSEDFPWDKDDFIICNIEIYENLGVKETKQKARKWVRNFFEKIVK